MGEATDQAAGTSPSPAAAASPPAADWPATSATGDRGVDAALHALAELTREPVEGHAQIFDALHDALHAELDAETETG
jgi:hypothetical protein